MNSDEKAVRAAVDRWFEVLNAMLSGDPMPFAGLFSRAEDVIYMGGEGTYRVGFEAAFADWKDQAAKSPGGRAVREDISIILSGDMAVVALRARANIKTADSGMTEHQVRQTHAFRKENGEWKMVLHHADEMPVWKALIGP